MEDIKQDLHNNRTYLWIVAGVFLGIAAVMATFRFIPNNGFMGTSQSADTTQPGVVSQETTKEYEAALKNPTEPYTDANGVTHPPIGVAPAPIAPGEAPKAPPVGGNGQPPVVPQAPKAPDTTKTPTPIVPTTPTQ
jgi:hypothetical protein